MVVIRTCKPTGRIVRKLSAADHVQLGGMNVHGTCGESAGGRGGMSGMTGQVRTRARDPILSSSVPVQITWICTQSDLVPTMLWRAGVPDIRVGLRPRAVSQRDQIDSID